MGTIDVMRKALEALEQYSGHMTARIDVWPGVPGEARMRVMRDEADATITALRAEIERLEAVEPVAWSISHDGKTPYMLWESGDGALLDLEVKRVGGTACKLALYAAPIAPATIPALTDEDVRTEVVRQHDDEGHVHFLNLAGWAYALAAERAGVQIKDTLQEPEGGAKQIGLEY